MTEAEGNYITAIDFGTENLKVLIARCTMNSVELLGFGSVQSNRITADDPLEKNIWKGGIQNFSETRKRLLQAIAIAEDEAGVRVEKTTVYAGISGDEVQLFDIESEISIANDNGIIMEQDVERSLRAAREKLLERESLSQMQVLETTSRFFYLDRGERAVRPLGETTRKLRAKIQCAACPREYSNLMTDLLRSVVPAYTTPQLVHTPKLPGYLVKDLFHSIGNFLTIDIGAGMTSFAVNAGGCFPAIGQIPVGCNHLENDLMQALAIDAMTAKRLLISMGSHYIGSLNHEEDGRERLLDVGEHQNSARPRQLPVSSIEKVLSCRLEELFHLIRENLTNSNVWQYTGDVFFLSGGALLLPGIAELAGRVLEKECRIWDYTASSSLIDPKNILREDPRLIMLCGLLLTAMKNYQVDQFRSHSRWQELRGRIRTFLKDIFNCG